MPASLATSSARVRRRSALRLVTVATDDKIVPTATTSRTSTAGTTRARGRSSAPNWTTGVSSHRSTVATQRQTLTASSPTPAVRPSSSSAWEQGCSKLWIRCFLHSSSYPSSTLSWSSCVHLSVQYTNFTLVFDQSINNVNMFTRLTAQYAKQQREGRGEGRGDLGYLRGTVYTGAVG